MDLKARVGRNLARLREKRGLSPHQLAKAAKLTQQFVVRLENAARTPSFEVLERLGAVLDVDPAEFFALGEEDSKPRMPPVPLPMVHLQGAASRLKPKDLEMVVELARRLGR